MVADDVKMELEVLDLDLLLGGVALGSGWTDDDDVTLEELRVLLLLWLLLLLL